jgi:hypothetical protein
LTLHGGYGLSSRAKGLTLDNVLEATVVLANTTVVTANTTQNSDLFWALRGAGAAFGVVTNFKFKTYTAPENNIIFSYNINPSSASNLAKMLTALQDFTINSQPDNMNMRLFLAAGTTLSGTFYGSRADYDKAIAPLASSMGLGSPTITVNSWLDTLGGFAYGPLKQAVPYDTHETFFSKSLMPDYLSADAITALSNYWNANARNNNRAWYLLIDCHGGKSSAISKVPADQTSYAHRNATFKMQFYDRTYFGNYDASWQSFLNGWVTAIMDTMPTVNFGMYINYADTSLSKDDAHKHYWKDNYAKLAQIKSVYDPKKLFEGPQLVGS